jgi:thymidine kinase
VDEAQFLAKAQVNQLALITDELNIPVLAYGLRSDFQAEPFEGSKYLLALADSLIEIKTICHCGRKATMNMRIDGQGNKVIEGAQVLIGGNDSYVATCRKHFRLGESQRIADKQAQLPLENGQ